MYIRNHWYVAATGTELGRALLGRWILNEPLVLYRTEAGAVVAMEDRCPHRRAALSQGKLIGDAVQCGYHGMEFGPDGGCKRIPGQTSIPPRIRARIYPTVERHGWVFVWMGEAAAADPALVPDYHWNVTPGWDPVFGYLNVKAEYRLVMDNLLDLTHETFIHATSIGERAVAETPITTEVDGQVVKVTRLMPDTPAPPLFRKLRGLDVIDRWQRITFEPPCNVKIDAGGVPSDTKDMSKALRWMVLNSMTPETDRTTHYFWAVTRCFEVGNAEVSKNIEKQVYGIFHEDQAVLESQQRMIETDPLRRPLLATNIDAGNVAARRIIDRMIAAERQPQAAE